MNTVDKSFNLICSDQMLLMVFDTEKSMTFVRTEANKEEVPTIFRG